MTEKKGMEKVMNNWTHFFLRENRSSSIINWNSLSVRQEFHQKHHILLHHLPCIQDVINRRTLKF